MKRTASKNSISDTQVVLLLFLRILVGWHFLYEGVVKLFDPSWSAGATLKQATALEMLMILI